MKTLVIVESPTKAKTISKFLGAKYNVESSFGHIRDLPKNKMGIDIENNFEPEYIIPKDKQKKVTELKKKAKPADSIYFATDEDREGEAISWHLAKIFELDPKKVQRITFHEITKTAILKSLENPKHIDINLVNSQQARRILDRLVGYELSPFLWKKVAKGLSAGRVQSVCVRLIVEREREIQAFKEEEYWTIESIFTKPDNKKDKIESKLYKISNKILDKMEISNKKQADNILDEIKKSKTFTVESIEKKEKKKKPPTPFITSTLQQQANNKFGYSAKQTMMIAQQLYEGINIKGEEHVGLITYMRTDSLNLSKDFTSETISYINKEHGVEYAVDKPREFKKKSKLAQEAHEAIRPTSILRHPDKIKDSLDEKQYKIYNLIWQRTCASQMTEAVMDNTTILIKTDDEKYLFKTTGSIIKFEGFLKVYQTETKETFLPTFTENETLDLKELNGIQHFTQPPARFSEASLIKALEENGIGRPSTYAPTIATIQSRNYVTKEEKQLHPTEIAFVVTDLLVEHFPKIVDYEFTAKMEDEFDEIASGKLKWQPMIKSFYDPFKKNLTKKYDEIDKKNITEEKTDEKCEKCKSDMIIKLGRFGKFIACTNYPECKNTKNISNGKIDNEEKEVLQEECPECGKTLEYKMGRFGKFVGCTGYPECKYIKSNLKKLDIKCPECKDGDLATKKTRRGKLFYACSNYPKCEFALWDKPTKDKCPECSSLLVEKKDDIICSNKECKNKKTEKNT